MSEYLYGPPHAELLHSEPDTAADLEMQHHTSGDLFVIEEWTVHPPKYHLDTAYPVEMLLENVLEWVHDSGELTDGTDEWFDPKDPAIIEAAHALYGVIADTVTWRQANRVNRKLVYRCTDNSAEFVRAEKWVLA